MVLQVLTFGARIARIDDNGYVTFSISPAISTKSEQRTIQNCATVDLLQLEDLIVEPSELKMEIHLSLLEY